MSFEKFLCAMNNGLMQKITKYKEYMSMKYSAINQPSISQTSLKLREHLWIGERKRQRSGKDWGNTVIFWTWDTTVLMNSQKLWLPAQDPVSQHSGIEVPTSSNLTGDSFWWRKGQLSLRMWSLVGQPCSSAWPHTYVHTSNTDQNQWVEGRHEIENKGGSICRNT